MACLNNCKTGQVGQSVSELLWFCHCYAVLCSCIWSWETIKNAQLLVAYVYEVEHGSPMQWMVPQLTWHIRITSEALCSGAKWFQAFRTANYNRQFTCKDCAPDWEPTIVVIRHRNVRSFYVTEWPTFNQSLPKLETTKSKPSATITRLFSVTRFMELLSLMTRAHYIFWCHSRKKSRSSSRWITHVTQTANHIVQSNIQIEFQF
jgi:hypothetical protein